MSIFDERGFGESPTKREEENEVELIYSTIQNLIDNRLRKLAGEGQSYELESMNLHTAELAVRIARSNIKKQK